MNKIEPLGHGNYYHIYNRGIDGCDLFRETTNYEYFFNLFLKHIEPIADTFAWVLMKNHFHILERIKDLSEVTKPFRTPPDLPGFKNLEGLRYHTISPKSNKMYYFCIENRSNQRHCSLLIVHYSSGPVVQWIERKFPKL